MLFLQITNGTAFIADIQKWGVDMRAGVAAGIQIAALLTERHRGYGWFR